MILHAQAKHGKPGLPWLVFLHGFSGDCHEWQEVGEAFADYSRLYVDLPGHGGSATISVDGFDDVTGLLCKTLVSYNILNFWLVGYSLGGRVAMMAACQELAGLCGVEFYSNLGLVITDEQHRFGVNQRKILREKGQNPDVLMMTATPIPRTLAITAFGDMDVSIIDELPKGRQPITTRWVKHEQFSEVLSWIKAEVAKDSQVYFISPLIEESETLDLKNAEALFAELNEYFGLFAKIGLLHGKMKNDEKDQIMQEFKAKKLDILVSTTVIEVGVDVPNATIMVIMDADRFGLSQLHQLRGRVGRGTKKSYAILVANPKSDSGKQRMKIMTETQNGFILAEEDLKMRGSGEIFGLRQSGLPEFIAADLVNDYNILEVARKEAVEIFKNADEFPDLIAQVNVDGGFD